MIMSNFENSKMNLIIIKLFIFSLVWLKLFVNQKQA